MYGVKYKIPFKDINNKAYEVRILANGFSGPAVELTGGPRPFVTEMKDDDIYEPVRFSSAQISYVDDINFGQIIPSSPLDYMVHLVDVSTGIVLWRGFISVDIYSQPYIAGPNVVTINARSFYDVLLSKEAELRDPGDDRCSVRHCLEMLAERYDELGVDPTIYFPQRWSPGDGDFTVYSGEHFPLELWFNRAVYEHREGVEDLVVYDSYKKIISDFCRLFGLSMHDADGQTLFFAKPWQTEYIRFNLSSWGETSDDTASNVLLSALNIDDASGTIGYVPVKAMCDVSIAEKKAQPTLVDIASCVDWVGTDSSHAAISGTGPTLFLSRTDALYDVVTGHISATGATYHKVGIGGFSETAIQGTQINEVSREEAEGFVFSGNSARGTHLFTIRTAELPWSQNVALIVKCKVAAISDDGFGYYIYGNRQRYGGMTENNGTMYPFQAVDVAGEKSSSLNVVVSYNRISHSSGGLVVSRESINKTASLVDDSSNDKEWRELSVLIDQIADRDAIFGDCEIAFYTDRLVAGCSYMVKDVSLDADMYAGGDRTEAQIARMNLRRRRAYYGTDDTINVNLPLCTKIPQANLIGYLWRESMRPNVEREMCIAPVDEIYDLELERDIKLEDSLIAELAAHYLEPKQKVMIGTSSDTVLLPIDNVQEGSRWYKQCGYSMNWADAHIDRKLIEL